MSVRIVRSASLLTAVVPLNVLIATVFGAGSAGAAPSTAPSPGSSAVRVPSQEPTVLGVPLSMAIWISVGVLAMVGAAMASRGDRRGTTNSAASDGSAP